MSRTQLVPFCLVLALLFTVVAPAEAVTVAWPGVIDVDVPGANWAYPDAYARYYFSVFELPVGTSITMTGQYPDSRFFSHETYNMAGNSVHYLPDFTIASDLPGQNPFADPLALPSLGPTPFRSSAPTKRPAPPTSCSCRPPTPMGCAGARSRTACT